MMFGALFAIVAGLAAQEAVTPPAAPAPTVLDSEQIILLKAQLEETSLLLKAAAATIARLETVMRLRAEWAKRGCAAENDPKTGLARCRAAEPANP